MANLWHSPEKEDTIGCSTTGASEAAMLGGLALKWQWRKKREAEGKSTNNPNIVCGPVQICWHKFVRYFDVEIREVPLMSDNLCMQPDQLKDYCDENTIGVVATLGSTFTGVYEPVQELARALNVIQNEISRATKGYKVDVDVDINSNGQTGIHKHILHLDKILFQIVSFKVSENIDTFFALIAMKIIINDLLGK